MKYKFGFTMVEIVIAMIILVIGFFPIYNLFKQGSGTAVNNIQETIATNYASDLINFCKDLRYSLIDKYHLFNGNDNPDPLVLENDTKIIEFFKEIDDTLTPPPSVDVPFIRSLTITKFARRGFMEWLTDLFKKRRKVPTFLIEVKVTFPRMGGRNNDDDVTLFSLIMD